MIGVYIAIHITLLLLGIVLIIPTRKGNTDNFTFMFALAIILLNIMFIGLQTYKLGYKNGQIDAHINKYKYELNVNPDSTRTWEEIGK